MRIRLDSDKGYFLISGKAANIAKTITSPKNNFRKERLLEKALDMISDMQTIFEPLEKVGPKMHENVFYRKLFFPDKKNRYKDKNLIKESISYSRKTIEDMLKEKDVPEKNIEQAADLFSYISDECSKKYKPENLSSGGSYSLAA